MQGAEFKSLLGATDDDDDDHHAEYDEDFIHEQTARDQLVHRINTATIVSAASPTHDEGCQSKQHGHHTSAHSPHTQANASSAIAWRYALIAVLTLIFCAAELTLAIYHNSLALLSDGFHNIGDLFALGIAYYCETV
jgi:Cation efflux family